MTSDKSHSRLSNDSPAAARSTILQRLKTSLLAGLLVVAPFSITIFLAWEIIGWIDSLVLPFVPEEYLPENPLPVHVPGFGLLIFLVFLIVVGWLAKNLFGRELIRIAEAWVARMPVVRSIYNGLKQILETIFMQSSNSFEHACVIEYPRRGIWAVGFVSTTAKGEIPTKALNGREMMSIFLPTTPNPTSGFLLFVPREDVILLDMSIEEAAKLVISAGLISPPASRPAIEAETDGQGAAPGIEPAERADPPAPDPADADARRPFSARNGRVSPGRAAESAARNPLIPPVKR